VLYTVKDGKVVLEKIVQTNDTLKRTAAAEMCTATLKLSVPTVIDREDNKVNTAYAGWPDRLVVVGANGRIAYKGGPGPRGFKTGEVESWLRENLKQTPAPR
jgi:type I thyroxine 5'-deiodinase